MSELWNTCAVSIYRHTCLHGIAYLPLVHKPTEDREHSYSTAQLGEGSVQEEATGWAVWGSHLSRATSQSPAPLASDGGGCHSWSAGPAGASGWVALRDPGENSKRSKQRAMTTFTSSHGKMLANAVPAMNSTK